MTKRRKFSLKHGCDHYDDGPNNILIYLKSWNDKEKQNSQLAPNFISLKFSGCFNTVAVINVGKTSKM